MTAPQKPQISAAAHAALAKYTYDPNTGLFTNKRLNKSWPGSMTRRMRNGVLAYELSIGRKTYPANRLAFYYMTGAFPEEQVLHINGVVTDNRWANLKEAPCNVANQSRRHTPRSIENADLPRGVYRRPRHKGGFQAQITTNDRQTALGSFATAEEAGAAYAAAKRLLHPDAIHHTTPTTPTTPTNTVNQARLNEIEVQTRQLLQKKNLLPKAN
jgi:hypothetical protein